MAKGLNKAERHAIKICTREMPRFGALQIFRMHRDIRRVVMAELRKRGYHHDAMLDCWTKREAYRKRDQPLPSDRIPSESGLDLAPVSWNGSGADRK